MQYDVIIVGAGACGLMAARDLAEAGYKVCLLEAMEAPGGRIASDMIAPGTVIETGAEFVHGNAPATNELLKEAGLETVPIEGKMIIVRNGVRMPEDHLQQGYDRFESLLDQLETDCTLADFLDQHMPETEYEEVNASVRLFAEGFALADINRVSAFSFREEWSHQQERQYRVKGGYMHLIRYLADQCTQCGVFFQFSSIVHSIDYKPGLVTVTAGNRSFTAKKVILTVSAGVIRQRAIKFIPSIEDKLSGYDRIGFGSVIKIPVLFKNSFWLQHEEELGFVLSNEVIPTWWTQLPARVPLLTGWLGGPDAASLSSLDEKLVLDKAVSSLANIFHLETSELYRQIEGYRISHWNSSPFTQGGYSFNTPESDTAKKMLQQPLDDTVYFAGEALYTGASQATVEAALVNGRSVAALIMASQASDHPTNRYSV